MREMIGKVKKMCAAALLAAAACLMVPAAALADSAASLAASYAGGGLFDISGDEAFVAEKKSRQRRLKASGAALPAEYRTERLSAVQSQGSLNLCWAYSPLCAGQTGIMKSDAGVPEELQFSPGHLGYATYHGGAESWDILGSSTWTKCGGNAIMAGSTLLRWYGAAPASSFATSSATAVPESALTASVTHLLGYERLPGPNDTGTEEGRAASVAEIKQAVMEYGAVCVDLYFERNVSYDAGTNSCFSESRKVANHQAVIVGWDDGKVTKAEGPGAFYVENSYGTSFGEDGFFWLSYEDASVTKPYVYIFEKTVQGEHLDRDLYSYDGIGYWTYMSRTGQSIEAANVFVAARDEQIDAIGFYVPAGGSYTAELRTGVKEGDPASGTKAASVSGSKAHFGFYTVRLGESVSVRKGTRFSVVLRTSQNGSGLMYFEGSSRVLGSDSDEVRLVRKTAVSEGETYVRVGDAAFTDILDYTFITDSGGKTSGKQYGNACIKAYGNPADGAGDDLGSRSAEVKPEEETAGKDTAEADVAADAEDQNLTDAETTQMNPAEEEPKKEEPKKEETEAAYVTVYGGVDYAPVYNFNYYMKKYPSLKKKYGSDPKGALRYFVKYGMKKMHRASASFNVKSYVREYASLRRKYGTTWKKYYLHYIRTGRKKGWHGTGCTKMKNALTVYRGKNYKKIYNFRYYISRYPSVKKKYEFDDYGALKYFVKYGRKKGQKAKK